jgi:uroporphyrinogen-III synthase
MSNELATLISRLGGEALCAPAVREEATDAGASVASLIDHLSDGSISAVFFQTGVGVKTFFKEAERQGRLAELLDALSKVTTIARGPKPTAVLKQNGVQISVSIREPFTTAEILQAIDGLQLEGTGVALLHYGERNEQLARSLLARGARLEEVSLYEWQLPQDLEPLKTLIGEVVGGRVDAVAFTSQIQVRHLFQVADGLGQSEELKRALNTKTFVAAVGPTCADAVESFGVTPRVVPQPPKMGPMMIALAEFIEQHGRRDPSP